MKDYSEKSDARDLAHVGIAARGVDASFAPLDQQEKHRSIVTVIGHRTEFKLDTSTLP